MDSKFLRIITLLILAFGLIFIPIYFINSNITQQTQAQIYQASSQLPIKNYAIVLGAKVNADGTMKPMLVARVAATAELYQQHKIKNILVTGKVRGAYDEVTPMKQYLMQHGIPENKIIVDGKGYDTLTSIQRAKNNFKIQDAIIVSQNFHLPRALYMANKAGLNAVGYAADKNKPLSVSQSIYYNGFYESLARIKMLWQLS